MSKKNIEMIKVDNPVKLPKKKQNINTYQMLNSYMSPDILTKQKSSIENFKNINNIIKDKSIPDEKKIEEINKLLPIWKKSALDYIDAIETSLKQDPVKVREASKEKYLKQKEERKNNKTQSE